MTVKPISQCLIDSFDRNYHVNEQIINVIKNVDLTVFREIQKLTPEQIIILRVLLKEQAIEMLDIYRFYRGEKL